MCQATLLVVFLRRACLQSLSLSWLWYTHHNLSKEELAFNHHHYTKDIFIKIIFSQC